VSEALVDPTPTAWIPLLAALLGLAVGSFLNVVVYRVPRGESLLHPGSHCPNCETALKPWHNVPIASWVVLRGRCAYCRAPISVRYPLVEAATALLFAAITLRFGLAPQVPAYLYLAAIAIIVVLIDFDVRMLPESVVIPSYVVSALLLAPAAAADSGWWTAERAILGMLALLAAFFCLALAYPAFIKFGDVKLAGLLGLYLGWLSWPALLTGTLATLVLAAFCTKTVALATHRRDAGSTAIAVPFGVCLVVTALLMLFVAAPAVGWL
jgi:leader peptidase (prepilin peptidase)/N-methyltransferase